MKYFRVINPDDLQVINPVTGWHFINRELYTEKELKRLCLPQNINYFNWQTGKHELYPTKDLFQVIEVSKRKIYWFFGARFTNEK